MKAVLIIALTLTLGVPQLVDAAEYRQFSEPCETALALSAAPKHMRNSAGVYVLGDSGYRLTRASSNGYHCLVERNHPDSIIPQCFDRSSTEANLKAVLDEGKMLARGESFESLALHRERALAEGRYPEPDGPGVVYMVSDFNFIQAGGKLLKVAPHVMFHAPGLTNEDIGAVPEASFDNPGLPIVTAPGPHGFMVSFTGRASDSADVLERCADELPGGLDLAPFPPAR